MGRKCRDIVIVGGGTAGLAAAVAAARKGADVLVLEKKCDTWWKWQLPRGDVCRGELYSRSTSCGCQGRSIL